MTVNEWVVKFCEVVDPEGKLYCDDSKNQLMQSDEFDLAFFISTINYLLSPVINAYFAHPGYLNPFCHLYNSVRCFDRKNCKECWFGRFNRCWDGRDFSDAMTEVWRTFVQLKEQYGRSDFLKKFGLNEENMSCKAVKHYPSLRMIRPKRSELISASEVLQYGLYEFGYFKPLKMEFQAIASSSLERWRK